MTAKQKADELVDRFYWTFGDGYLGEQHIQLALITVDEMIKQLPFTDLNTYIGKWCEQQRQFLNEVKSEILMHKI